LEELLQSIHQTDIPSSLVEDLGQGHWINFELELREEPAILAAVGRRLEVTKVLAR
jgi:hypothetical protein